MNRKNIFPFLLGVTLASSVYMAYHLGLMDGLELKTVDLRFKIRGSVPPQLPVVLVSIDQDSFDELNLPWPWPRSLHAALIQKLANSRASVIAFDILFFEPSAHPGEDQELAHAIKAAGNVVLGAELTEVNSDFGPKLTMNLPVPVIREDALGYGPVNLTRDRDGVVRRTQEALAFQDLAYPSFAYRIYQVLTARQKKAEAAVSLEPRLINFRGPPGTYRKVPYYRVLNDEIEPSFFRDKIVLIGAFAPSLHDVYATPFSASEPMAGVEVQANFVDTLFSNNAIVPISSRSHALIFIAVCALTIWVSIHRIPLRAFVIVFALVASYAAIGLQLFSEYQLWLPVTPTIFGIVLSYGGLTLNNYIREQQERIRLRATFSKYVSSDIVDEILEDREGLGLGGKRKHITVLFSDIRGFTTISEQIGPEQVVSVLSDYLAQVTRIVFKHGGTVDKFIGDAVMAIFGAPKSHGDDARRAVETGLEMIEMVESMGLKWTEMIGAALKVGVGINSGDAVVGSIGSEIRSDFTAIGDAVNLASRLEGLTKELGVPILISEFTAAELNGAVPLTPLGQVKVTGREAPLLVYTSASFAGGQVDSAVEAAEPYIQRTK